MINTLSQTTTDRLVARFVEIGLLQDKALTHHKTARYNKLYDENESILDELKSRPGDERRSLLPLRDHDNIQVRLNATKATLAIDPDGSRRVLKAIAESGLFPQAGDAGMSIRALQQGIFQPT